MGAKLVHPPRLTLPQTRQLIRADALDDLEGKALAGCAVPLALQCPVGMPPTAQVGAMGREPGS